MTHDRLYLAVWHDQLLSGAAEIKTVCDADDDDDDDLETKPNTCVRVILNVTLALLS